MKQLELPFIKPAPVIPIGHSKEFGWYIPFMMSSGICLYLRRNGRWLKISGSMLEENVQTPLWTGYFFSEVEARATLNKVGLPTLDDLK